MVQINNLPVSSVLLLILALALSLSIAPNLLAASKETSLALKEITLSTHDLFPYGSYQKDGSFKGVAYDPIHCALKKMSIKLNLKVLPWRRAQLEVKSGVSDGFFAGSQNDTRDNYAVRSIEVADQIWQWYLLKDSGWNTTTKEFKVNASVSSFLGANMQLYLTENQYRVTSAPANTRQLAEMLMLGRLDAALANNYVMDDILQKRGIEDRIRREVLKSKPLYVYFSKPFIANYPKFLPGFNDAIKACKN